MYVLLPFTLPQYSQPLHFRYSPLAFTLFTMHSFYITASYLSIFSIELFLFFPSKKTTFRVASSQCSGTSASLTVLLYFFSSSVERPVAAAALLCHPVQRFRVYLRSLQKFFDLYVFVLYVERERPALLRHAERDESRKQPRVRSAAVGKWLRLRIP